MVSFAGYSFNKAHSASFAVESYMSLYLKTYFPQEFMVAVINNFGGFYSSELYFLELLKAKGDIEPLVSITVTVHEYRRFEKYIPVLFISNDCRKN